MPHRLVPLRGRAAGGGALDRLGLQPPVPVDEGEPLRAGGQQVRAVVPQEPGVRRRAGGAQPQVRRDRVDRRGRRLAVGQVHLVAVAEPELPLHGGEGLAVPARGRPVGRALGCPRNRTTRGVVHEQRVAHPHPHRIRYVAAGVRRQVRPARVAEVADPAHRRVTAVAGHLLRENGEDVVADHLGPAVLVARDLADGGVVGQGHVLRAQEPQDRPAPGPGSRPAAVQPEHPVVRRRQLDEPLHGVGAQPCSRNVRTSCSPCWVRIDSGWNCTPHKGFSRCATPITTLPSVPSHQAVAVSTSGSARAASEW